MTILLPWERFIVDGIDYTISCETDMLKGTQQLIVRDINDDSVADMNVDLDTESCAVTYHGYDYISESSYSFCEYMDKSLVELGSWLASTHPINS